MITRRHLIQGSLYGLGALALPGMAAMLNARGFTHGVASGEPRADSLLLWTRYVAQHAERLRVEVAADTLFTRVIAEGEAFTDPARDHTARVTVSGLAPGRWHYYRFIAPDGRISAVGRSRTLPIGEVSRFGIGLFSCSNLPFGWFNAYAHACLRSDLDLIVHVGDYLYEYPRGDYPDARTALPERVIEPAGELITLADYHLRYACYRLDPDLQRLHQSYPMISQWDDHEIANDAWMNGAENHQPEREGEWSVRRELALRAYRDWMPVSDAQWTRYDIGSLASLYKLETRLTGRSAPLDLETALRGRKDLPAALAEFRDGPFADPARTMLGFEQERWLAEQMRRSVQSGRAWQLLAQQTLFGDIRAPQGAERWLAADAAEYIRRRARVGALAAQAGLPYDFDAWGGFPAARQRLLESSLAAKADLVVLSGDSHNAWGQNLSIAEGIRGRRPVGVEFATPSVTSPGFESLLSRAEPAELAASLRATNPGLMFSDTARRGYVSLTLSPGEIVGRWHFLAGIRERSTALADTYALRARRGRRVLEAG